MENEVKVDIGPPPGEMVVESEIESFEDLGPGQGSTISVNLLKNFRLLEAPYLVRVDILKFNCRQYTFIIL